METSLDKVDNFIEIKNVTKMYGDFVAVDSVSLEIGKGNIFCLLGGSGCGKSTLLRMIAGFEEISSGQILIDGEDVANYSPDKLPVNMMFQSYALFPHMTVESNIGYGLRRDNVPKNEITTRVADILDMVKLNDFAKRKPDQLSGGQRQRVALARSLIKQPKVLLLDEPLAALDKKLREDTQFELMRIQKDLGITFVVVTHDQEEAMTISDRIGVMERGKIMQVGPPRELYELPNSLFIANFLGGLNSFDGRVLSSEGAFCDVKLKGIDMVVRIADEMPYEDGQRVFITVRPEKVEIFADTKGQSDMTNSYKGEVDSIGYLGHLTIYKVKLDRGIRLTVTESNIHMSAKSKIRKNDRVRIDWPARSSGIFSA